MTIVFDIAASTDGSNGVWWNESYLPASVGISNGFVRMDVLNASSVSQSGDPLPASMFPAGTVPAYPGLLRLRGNAALNARQLNLTDFPTSVTGNIDFTDSVEDAVIIACRVSGTSIWAAYELGTDRTDAYRGLSIVSHNGFTAGGTSSAEVTQSFVSEVRDNHANTEIEVVFANSSVSGFDRDTLDIPTAITSVDIDPSDFSLGSMTGSLTLTATNETPVTVNPPARSLGDLTGSVSLNAQDPPFETSGIWYATEPGSPGSLIKFTVDPSDVERFSFPPNCDNPVFDRSR